jgi:hypothetical protein
MEGDRLFCIVSPGTGSESSVSSRENLFAKHELDNHKVLSDSAAVGHFKNPRKLGLSVMIPTYFPFISSFLIT